LKLRPSELFESKELIDSKHLELVVEELQEPLVEDVLEVEEPPKKRKIKDNYDLSS
jgi:hypothetical protein